MPPTAKIFRILVLTLAAMVLVFVGIGYRLTDKWLVDSDRVITAAPPRVEALLRDFALWQDWSGMTVELGAGLRREITGTAGEVGHSVRWTGAQGDAILRLAKVETGRVDYEFLSRRSEDTAATLVARGHIVYRAEGDGTRVEWHDEGELRTLVERWIGWFGALQEKVRQIQGSSLAGLQTAIDSAAAK